MNRTLLEQQRQTLDEAITGVFTDATAEDHHDPGELTLSGLGGCTRKAALQLAGHTPTDDDSHREQRASHLGRATHDWFLPRLAARLGRELTMIEHDVILPVRGLHIRGRLDLATLAVGAGLLLDLKTYGYDQADPGQPPSRARLMQVWGYTMGLRAQGYSIETVAILPMSRIHGGTDGLWLAEFGPQEEAIVDARIRDLIHHAKAPFFAPRDGHRGPGLDMECDSCPFRSQCWPGAQPAQAAQVRTDADVVNHAVRYAEAAAQEGAWKEEKTYHATALHRTRPGPYEADGYEVEIKTTGGGKRLNQSQAKALLAENGLPVPMTTDRESRRAVVKRRPLA
ncbi:PD-(D/E)XK nuclease family protein [Kitasatospora aureofaciens]|uniref:PD-(D/E)XK nuclease family protein n=1 Tax=Kitasatospora aureofaciens TaxID=1894 RepID=UPI00052747E7|nr:PD-(D/E)XK nuclease family protein [Kitasatospora aureofaciens]